MIHYSQTTRAAVPAENPWWWSLLKDGQNSLHCADLRRGLGSRSRQESLILCWRTAMHDPSQRLRRMAPCTTLRTLTRLRSALTKEVDSAQDKNGRRRTIELVNWRRDSELRTARRFFTVTTLAGVRGGSKLSSTNPDVEGAAGSDEKLVDGLRIDHIRTACAIPRTTLRLERTSPVERGRRSRRSWNPGESLPQQWKTAGTTGTTRSVDRPRAHQPEGHYETGFPDTKLREGDPAWW